MFKVIKSKATLSALALSLFLLHGAPSTALAELGNESSGGGNARPTLATPDQIREAIDTARELLPYYFAAFEQTASYSLKQIDESQGAAIPREARSIAKLFPQGDGSGLFKILKRVKLDIRTNDACYEPKKPKEERDGSAIAPNKICISIPRLVARKFSTQEITTQALALMVHEVSHLGGLKDEDDANIIQGFALAARVSDGITPASLEHGSRKLVSFLDSVQQGLLSVESAVSAGAAHAQLCNEVRSYISLSQSYFDYAGGEVVTAAFVGALSILRAEGAAALKDLYVRSTWFGQTCAPENDSAKVFWRKVMQLSGTSDIDAVAVFIYNFVPWGNLSSPEALVQNAKDNTVLKSFPAAQRQPFAYLAVGDIDALKREIARIRTTVAVIKSGLVGPADD